MKVLSSRLNNTRGASAVKLSRRLSVTSSALPRLQPIDDEYAKWHTFDTYANWLIPGSVLLGRYPFVEPSRCKTREQGETQLDKILRVGGVDTFLSLQEELPPQDQMKLGGINGFLPYRATAELIQAALNGPPPMEGLHALRTPDLNKFLPPKKKQASSTIPEAPRKTLNFLHHPIVDLGLPDASPESLSFLLADLQRRIEAGEKLYIHCWGGRGRAGTIGACLLGKAYGLSADEALLRVQKAFDTRMDEKRRSPETDAQHKFVSDYIKDL